MKRLPAVASLVLLLGAAPAPEKTPAPLTAEGAAIRAHVAYLAADGLQGREAGSQGFDTAAQYVAQQFAAAGLQPGDRKSVV